jgi:hypothetical protein
MLLYTNLHSDVKVYLQHFLLIYLFFFIIIIVIIYIFGGALGGVYASYFGIVTCDPINIS